jgi:hypothetical protein
MNYHNESRQMEDTDPPKARGGRRSNGTFMKGVSGNPSGRSMTVLEIMRAAQKICPKVLRELERIVDDPCASNRDRIAAGGMILDRGLGKPVVPVYSGANNMPVEMLASPDVDGEGAPTALLRAVKGERE